MARIIGLMSVLLAVAGCMTVFEAHQAQEAVAPTGAGVIEDSSCEKISLVDYSLKELVEFAMTNRPAVASAALAVEDARLALHQIAADAPLVSYSPWTSPHLSLSGSYSESSAADKHLKLKTDGNVSAGLSLQILLYDFGRNQSLASAQVERLLAAEHEFIRTGYMVFEDVAKSYFELMESDALLEVAQTNVVEFALHYRQAKERLDVGSAKQVDVTRAALDLAEAEEATIVASNRVSIAGANLMKALGVDAARGVRDEVFPATGSRLNAVMRGFASTDYTVADAFGLARTNSPAMAISRARLRAASRDVDYAIADLMPSVSAEVGLNWADPLWAWHWGVNALQSLFVGYRKTTAVDRAVVAMKAAAVNVEELEQQLSLDIESAIAVRDNAVSACESAKVTMRSAKENFELVKAQFDEGEASRVDFSDSVAYLATARGNRISAFYGGQLAEARLFALIGMLPQYNEEIVNEE